MIEHIALFFTLMVGHALADYPLQGDYLARFKAPSTADGRRSLSIFSQADPPWRWIMSMHCLIHAGFVYLITGHLILAFVEFVAHFNIDYLKCEGRISFMQDQLLHVACKLGYVGMLWLVA